MRFRDDIDVDTTWIVSDTHFGHDNIVGFCHRPEDHEQVMIAEWRAHVPDDATVLHLGDLCYKSNARFKNLTAKELTGERKLLIQGNHDRQRFSFYRDCGFRVVKPFAVKWGEKRCETCVGTGSLESSDSTDDSWWDCPVCAGTGRVNDAYDIQFSHYPAKPGELAANEWRLHGHIHNNGYTRDAFVPFVSRQVNLSVEQTKYRPVNLGALLRGCLMGDFPETTDEQLAEARDRKEQIRDR